MSQVRENILGLPVASGSAFYVKEAASSESGVASISNVTLQTSKFIGAQSRCEYLMPQMTQLNWALRAFENHVPDCRLLFDQAMETPDPSQAIELFDELVRMAVGSAAAPCMRIIPVYAVMQNAYKSAESIQDSLSGHYHYDGYVSVAPKGGFGPQPKAITYDDLSYAGKRMAASWKTLVDAEDLYELGRLDEIVNMYKRNALAQVGESLRAEDMRRLLSSVGAQNAQPDWMIDTDVRVDPQTGAILFDGEALVDLDRIARYFPSGDRGMLPYHNGQRHIARWARDHNVAMLRRPEYRDVEVIDTALFVGNNHPTVAMRDITGHISQVDLGDPTTSDKAQASLDAYSLFRLTYGGVTEYMMIRRLPGVSTQTRQSQAWNVWREHHGGLADAGSGTRTANDILAIRDRLAYEGMLLPAYKQLLADIHGAIAHSSAVIAGEAGTPTAAAFYDLVNALSAAASVTTNIDLARVIAQIDKDLAVIKPQLPKITDLKSLSPREALTDKGYTVIGSGRYGPSEDRVTALIPVIGRGVTPIVYELAENTLEPVKRLDAAVVLEEPPSTVYSPVRTMIATALLNRLIGYLNGKNTPAGYNFDPYDPKNPFGAGQARPCPRVLLNRQIDRYEQALVNVIDNANVDEMPDILRIVQQLVDAKYFLNHVDEVVDAVMEREDWIYMLQSLILGCVVEDGATVTDTNGNDVVSLYPGTVPREAAKFLFGTVMAELKTLPAYAQIVADATAYGIQGPIDLRNAANANRVIRAEILFARAVNGLEMLVSLLDGSNSLIKNVHARGIQSLIDADLALELLQALTKVFNRDYLGLVDQVEFEAPWDCAEWTTQFAAFAVSVKSEPIAYEIVDVAAEAAADSGLAAVTSALARAGFEWYEIAPKSLRVRGADQSTRTIGGVRYMAGQPGAGEHCLYNDAPVSQQAIKITTICPSYDIEAYNLIKAYLTMNTSRTYFAQTVGKDIADRYTIRLPISVNDEALNDILGPNALLIRQQMHTAGLQIEKSPALANVAMIVPYVANYLQTPAITRDVYVPQIMQIDTSKSLAMTSGVTVMPESGMQALSPTNGLAVTVTERRSVSTALPWVGA